MRPVSVYAQVSDEQYQLLVSALHHQWRTAARIVMVLLSVYGWPPSEIAALLHCHAGTVRRWIDRYDLEGLAGLPDRRVPFFGVSWGVVGVRRGWGFVAVVGDWLV